jgi:hypothetical protein
MNGKFRFRPEDLVNPSSVKVNIQFSSTRIDFIYHDRDSTLAACISNERSGFALIAAEERCSSLQGTDTSKQIRQHAI